MLRVLSWNIEGGLSETATDRPDKILEKIYKINADIVFLAEAHADKMPEKYLHKLKGYAGPDGCLIDVKYGNSKNYMTMVSRRKVEASKVLMLGDYRNCIRFKIDNLVVYGIHLDDKTEKTRCDMVKDLLEDAKKFKHVIIMGDFNAMYGDGFRAMLVRFVGRIGSRLPFGTMWRSIFRRAVGMAGGQVMREFLRSGFIDTNIRRKPTETLKMDGIRFMPQWPLIQIDHIMVRGVKFSDFEVYNTGLADHLALSAKVSE